MTSFKRISAAIEIMNLAVKYKKQDQERCKRKKESAIKASAKLNKSPRGQARYFVRSIFTMFLTLPEFVAPLKTKSLLGYELKELKSHIENQFDKRMNWQNYGRHGWHIDHKVPVSSFEIKKLGDAEFKKCWSLGNLRPLWAKENLKKGKNNYE